MSGDLEDGEIEDGEIEEGASEVVGKSVDEKTQITYTPSPRVKKQSERTTKLNVLSQKTKRTSTGNQRHADSAKAGPVEDDWAGKVERAIEAALVGGDKGKQTNVGSGSSSTNRSAENAGTSIQQRKRKKKHKDEDGSKSKVT